MGQNYMIYIDPKKYKSRNKGFGATDLKDLGDYQAFSDVKLKLHGLQMA